MPLMVAKWLRFLMDYLSRISISENLFVPIIYMIDKTPHQIPFSGLVMVVIALNNHTNDLATAIAVFRFGFDVNAGSRRYGYRLICSSGH